MYLDKGIRAKNAEAPESPPGQPAPQEVQRLAGFFKALSEPARLQILRSLSEECRPVSDVVLLTGLPQPLVSHHLRILRDAGLARPQRRGSYVYY